ncbi:phosphate/phosphite/phosphonate ABC transporter substrate-binding protein [Dissulfurirhabdus thermomarina]|uniref:Phosphate/phosphite/phosphonate ABC transporter substrate-binding protein n=1 Tax=Dissulfurirhabdus thermomarina TaxID=1765737 RepID=A0A6N9TSZ8_DISTH|nr:phosphate/phosphite/phosphonate ABC transporter substrate-binding protein [Dissulfurirhabdus thermomarina]NDY42864.1 phosphate/phosphite/phosphonate ABC transporter substrate-binding protein [Dissulfurirhabdus thermomarina]NMX24438.1 phosphate/phosphite/phosphonate ABC transporter substrate-binding protein [Dissulfurirhabdus thermomarina]
MDEEKDDPRRRIRGRATLAALLAPVLLAAAACDRDAPAPKPARRAAGGPPLRLGLLPEQNVFRQLERYEPIGVYLARHIGRPVRFRILGRYGNLIHNFRALRLDGAFFGSFTYALARKKLGVEILARPEGLDGRSTYFGLLFARRDGGIRSARDMRGKRFVFVDRATTAGYLLPLAYFRQHGITDPAAYFAETYFSGTHEDAIMDVLEGRADVGAAKNTVFARMARENPAVERELRILATSPEVPENGLAVRSDLDPALKRKLKDVLLGMAADPEGRRLLRAFGARRFIETRDADYRPVYDYAALAGLDLEHYDYLND